MNSMHDSARVADLMTHGVVTCPSDTNLAQVAAILASRNVHAVFVLGPSGQPAGVVSDFDLLAGEWLGTDPESLRAMQNVTAGELMTSPVEAIGSSFPAADAARRMRELRISRLLVNDERGSPVGVISVSDLVAPIGRPSGKRRSVRDVMSYAIVTCLPNTPVKAVARAMTERRSRSVVVVDTSGRGVGVITGRDLISLYQPGEHPEMADELMHTPIITADPALALSAAAELMIRHEVHRLVVVDPSDPENVPIGLVSTSDIVAEMAQERSVWRSPQRT